MIKLTNSVSGGSGEMPRGTMSGDDMATGQMPGTAGEMPMGDMMGSSTASSGQMSASTGEMPAGAMMNGATGVSDQLLSGSEMPVGSMNESVSSQATENQANNIELSGTWKLQLTAALSNAK